MKIIGIVLLSVLLTNLLPTGKTSALIKNTVRLCAYLCILAPAFDFFVSLNGKNQPKFNEIFTDYFSETVIPTDEFYIKYCSEKSIENAENSIEKRILDEYEISVDIILRASVEVNSFEIKIEKGILKAFNCENETLLKEICVTLENEYCVPFDFLKGENDEMDDS